MLAGTNTGWYAKGSSSRLKIDIHDDVNRVVYCADLDDELTFLFFMQDQEAHKALG